MAFNSYIDLGSSGTLKRGDLDDQLSSALAAQLSSALSDAITSGLSGLTVKNELVLNTNNVQGWLKVGTVNGSAAILASIDHSTWYPIVNESGSSSTPANVTFEWDSETEYAVDDIVLSNGLWYIATATSTNQTPAPGSTYWRILSSGNRRVIVTTFAQFVHALETTSSGAPLHIIISGALDDEDSNQATTITVRNSNVVIESYENDSLTAYGLVFTTVSGFAPVIYWHSHGMELSVNSISASSCTLYMADMNLTKVCTLSGNIVYQRSVGAGSYITSTPGPYFDAWETTTADGFYVPRNLNSLNNINSGTGLTSGTLLYAHDAQNGRMGYLTLPDLTQIVGERAARMWKIDSQGTLSNLPNSATVSEGYVYYATNTGDLYRKGSTTWEGPYAFRGPTGSNGSSGTNGFSPVVSITSFNSGGSTGRELLITDAEHPSGQTFKIYDGRNGSATMPTISASATALAAGATPTATVTSSAQGVYTISLGMPVGAVPTFTCSASALAADATPTVNVVSTGATSFRFNFGIPVVSSIDDVLDVSLPLVVSGGTMSLNKTAPEFSHMHPMSAVSGLTALSSAVTELSSAVEDKADASDIKDTAITIRQTGRADQTFTLNQSTAATIQLDGGVSDLSSLVTKTGLDTTLDAIFRTSTPAVARLLWSEADISTEKLIFGDSAASGVAHHKVETTATSFPSVESITDSGATPITKAAFYLEPKKSITITNGLEAQNFNTPVWHERRTINIWLYQAAAATTDAYSSILYLTGPYGSGNGETFTWSLIPYGSKWILTSGSASLEIDNVVGAWHMLTFVESIESVECYMDGSFEGSITKPASTRNYILYQIGLCGSYYSSGVSGTPDKTVQVYFSGFEVWGYCFSLTQISTLYNGALSAEKEGRPYREVCYCENGEVDVRPGWIFYVSQPLVWNGTAFAATPLRLLSPSAEIKEGQADIYVKTTIANLQYQIGSASAVSLTTSAGDIIHFKVTTFGGTSMYIQSEVL